MITVYLRGGLGNQMFQYAAGLAAAERNGTDVVFDAVFLQDRFPRRNFTYRTYDLDVFGIEPRVTPLSHASARFPIGGLWLALDLAGIFFRKTFGIQRVIREHGDAFEPAVLTSPDDTLLIGAWQNENYFRAIEGEVRERFRFTFNMDDEASRIEKEITASNSVALCVRRGDYVKFANAKKVMGDTNAEYYERAIAYMKSHVKDPRFFVFSDDLAWCKEHLPLPADSVFIGPMGPKWTYHLKLVSLCKHAVIANSTFYWWGAWLNSYVDKIVVAPARWYADREAQPDIVPERWVKL